MVPSHSDLFLLPNIASLIFPGKTTFKCASTYIPKRSLQRHTYKVGAVISALVDIPHTHLKSQDTEN